MLVVPVAVTSKEWLRKLQGPGVADMSVRPTIPSVGRRPDEPMREVEACIESEMRRLDPEAYAPAVGTATCAGTPTPAPSRAQNR